MNHARLTLIMLAFCTAMLACGEVSAQARGPSAKNLRGRAPEKSDAATRAAKLAELDAWLRRLVGRFHYDGEVQSMSEICDPKPVYPCMDHEVPGRLRLEGDYFYSIFRTVGTGDCAGFGTGPGVRCTVDVKWPRTGDSPWWVGEWSWGGALDPAMMLYGLDPDNLGIHLLLVDSQSIAQGGLGTLQGDTVTFRTGCRHYPGGRCTQVITIRAPADGKPIETGMKIDVGFKMAGYTFSMRRLPPRP